jgi:hypothetical protein
VQLEADPTRSVKWWGEVDRLIASLPPALFRQVKLLEYELALRYSQTGQFHDIFLGPDYPPALSVATWLLHDLEIRSSTTRDEAERRLFVASVLLVARVQIVDGLRDSRGFTTDDRVALVQWLSERAAAEIARVVPDDSSYWDAYDLIASEEGNRLAASSEPDGHHTAHDPEALLASPFSAPMRMVALGALVACDRLDLRVAVAEMLEQTADAYQVIADLASMPRDLELGRASYPIAFIARMALIPIQPATTPEVILGAMVATGSLNPIVESAIDRLRSARKVAIELRLPTFAAFLTDAETLFRGRLESWTVGGTGDASARSAPPVVPSMAALPQAIGMTEAFLLADPTFRESWETHREGMLGEPEVSSRFPVGLILEILCRRGLDVRGAIDELLDFTVANEFRYYDHPRSGVDTDTIGVFLRLRPHATASGAYERTVAAVLECLDRNVHERRAVPVWLSGCAGAQDSESSVIALGEDCGTVAAHLLLGLLAAGDAREAMLIGTQGLLDRIGSVGLAANVNYPPLFAMGVYFRLLRLLEAHEGVPAVRGIESARSALTDALQRAVSIKPASAQDAALLMLACHEANREDLIHADWTVQVLKRQRFDGSWVGEAFAAAPNRGRSVSWYSSTLLTTALCFDALARQSQV